MTRCALLVLSIAIGLMAVIFMLIPGLVVAIGLTDPGHGTARIPALAWRMHRSLSPTYERWARARIASGSAASLDVSNISGTEWPLFGSVFYLQATES
ncbi:MAG: hypothetical protein HY815_32730, partial [Candidatus Riflebacteria bacterium]|nr:hypothetical protein [Candidatus Riflebacteria bacterium]